MLKRRDVVQHSTVPVLRGMSIIMREGMHASFEHFFCWPDYMPESGEYIWMGQRVCCSEHFPTSPGSKLIKLAVLFPPMRHMVEGIVKRDLNLCTSVSNILDLFDRVDGTVNSRQIPSRPTEAL